MLTRAFGPMTLGISADLVGAKTQAAHEWQVGLHVGEREGPHVPAHGAHAPPLSTTTSTTARATFPANFLAMLARAMTSGRQDRLLAAARGGSRGPRMFFDILNPFMTSIF